jgi:hypothetical protein
MVKVITADQNAPTAIGRSAPMIQAPMYGTRKKNQKITSTSGTERIRFT